MIKMNLKVVDGRALTKLHILKPAKARKSCKFTGRFGRRRKCRIDMRKLIRQNISQKMRQV